jgi:hypothetical protein
MSIEVCSWYRKFDGHYSISCVSEHGKRANGNFKPYPYDSSMEAKWDFKYCPYCGNEIEVVEMDD